jgi:predicted helicase
MSIILINQYYNNLDRAIHFGKSKNEQSIRNHFWNLLNDYARKLNYEVVTEVSCQGTKGAKVRPDGILKNLFGLDIGLWESKDEKDNIDDEIDTKLKKGYPFTNILFEDSQTAVLFQRGEEIQRISVREADKLNDIITHFISFKSDTVHKFEDALESFKTDIPVIVETLRKRIDETRILNPDFIKASETFLKLCQAEINPDITDADIREMMIQHILTSDIFNKIFDDPEFHRHNNIALELEKLISVLFTYSERRNLLGDIEHYYDAINSTAAGISDHHEKQKFLKVLYETFYKKYNPKAADRLGVVYTPNEIVQFMVESTDFLLFKHFGKTLADKNVEILDPATGTGTFITSIIDHIPKQNLAYKYQNEIHANEVAILPYYVANLNIEFTFKQKMCYYEEFKNICFVDTLDNTDALAYIGKQHSLFGLSSENSDRIKRQNNKKISIIIGNPPYNANQANENENNKNREYPKIDRRIKDTYIKHSTAQKTKVYDMYARFYRWASDRLNNNGILAFITNRSFINSRTFDGFRKCIQNDFINCYIIDTKSDVRTNPKIAGTTHNVFGIQTGVAIMFLVKKEVQNGECSIEYTSMEDEWRKQEKLDWFRNNKLENISFEKITPDKNNNWINLSYNDFENLIPVANKNTKTGINESSIFKLFSLGTVTNRDDWVYDFNKDNLNDKVKYFCEFYEHEKIRWNKSNKNIKINDFVDRTIKWTEELETHLKRGSSLAFNHSNNRIANYRPFIKKFAYVDNIITHRIYQNDKIWGIEQHLENTAICMTIHPQVKILFFCCNSIVDQGFGSRATTILPLYYYTKNGERKSNITDWGVEIFVNHYKDNKITKESIFQYTYGVLSNPLYRQKYELNLKREFPRLPFYSEFWKWVNWGKQLIEMHTNYEKIEPFSLKEMQIQATNKVKFQKEMFQIAAEPQSLYAKKPSVKIKLKADKDAGVIEIDELTYLSGIPKEAWEYKLGNRSALEWVLDQYKEKKPSDPTIAEKFNTYKFSDYKSQVIDLLKRVCTVSVETIKIIKAMEESTE